MVRSWRLEGLTFGAIPHLLVLLPHKLPSHHFHLNIVQLFQMLFYQLLQLLLGLVMQTRRNLFRWQKKRGILIFFWK